MVDNLLLLVPIEGILLTFAAALFVSVIQLLLLLDVDEFDAVPPVVTGCDVSTFIITSSQNQPRRIASKRRLVQVDGECTCQYFFVMSHAK